MTKTREEIDRELANTLIREKETEFPDEEIKKVLEELGLIDVKDGKRRPLGLTE